MVQDNQYFGPWGGNPNDPSGKAASGNMFMNWVSNLKKIFFNRETNCSAFCVIQQMKPPSPSMKFKLTPFLNFLN